MTSLQFVPAPVKPQAPDYASIKQANDARIAAAEAARRAEAARQAQLAIQQAQAAQIAPTPVITAPSDAKLFIYSHESGNRTDAINSYSGACGLGQALPCSKLPCSLSDYACQDAWFSQYALSRYGSWENAQAFWIVHSWW